jgi:uroporphyrinogen-III decarboxylase
MVLWDDANSLYISPRMFEKYSVPVLRRYADIAHQHGTVLVNQTCGKIGAFLDLCTQTDADSIDWVTPPPAGDVLPTQAQAVWGDKIAIQLAIVPAVMRDGSPEQVEEHIHALLRGLDPHKDLAIMIPPPVGTPLANVRRAVCSMKHPNQS